MDNFKRNRPMQPRRTSSVDGFSRRPGNTSNRTQSGARASSVSGQRNIGDFRRTDGFHFAKPGRPVQDDLKRTTGRRQRANEAMELDMPPARKRARTKDKKNRHVIRKSLSTLSILILVGGGYLFGKGYLSLLSVFKGGGSAAALHDNVDPSALKGEGDGRVNILLLGRGGEGHDGADLTDTIIVASIDPVNKKAAMLGIPRDLWVQPDGYGGMKVNSVFAAGKNMAEYGQDANAEGIKLLEQTLEDTIGIPLHYHVIVDFNGFRQAVDAVGGVTIDVPEELAVYDYMHYGGSPYILDVGEGRQDFDGLRALMFTRTRKTSPRGDFDRSERQRVTMLALKDRVLSLGTFSNPWKINELLSTLGNHVSSNLKTEEVLRVYEIIEGIPNTEIASIGLADEPNSLVTTSNINGLSVVVPKAGMYDYSAIKYFVRNSLKDGFLSNEDAIVAVYNGTDIPGLAGRTADELESFGYNVSAIGDAPQKGQVETILVDLSGGEKKYTKAYLEKRFGVTASSSIPFTGIEPGEADFVIILGTNEESRLEN